MLVDKEKWLQNYKICKNCPQFFKATRQCSICGCFMPLKTRLEGFECPLWYWTNKKPKEETDA